jgi:hypothetical protein
LSQVIACGMKRVPMLPRVSYLDVVHLQLSKLRIPGTYGGGHQHHLPEIGIDFESRLHCRSDLLICQKLSPGVA